MTLIQYRKKLLELDLKPINNKKDYVKFMKQRDQLLSIYLTKKRGNNDNNTIKKRNI